mgnify:CR=1
MDVEKCRKILQFHTCIYEKNFVYLQSLIDYQEIDKVMSSGIELD